jgi:SAM-dependent methyltransferase
LDWGCGSGHYSYFLTHSGWKTEAFSFDEAPKYLTASALFHHSKAKGDDPVRLPYGDETFDAVFSIGVLEHVHERGGDQTRSVLEIERVLKPGGQFLIFHLPNQFSWIEALVRFLNRFKSFPKHEHSKLFTKASVESLLSGTTFEIKEYGRYNTLPRNTFNRLPQALRNRPWLCACVDLLDDALTTLFPFVSQNWFFILQKKGTNVSS